MEKQLKRQYLTVAEIQQQYLPISKKRIRALAKRYLTIKMIGNRIFVDRRELEQLLIQADEPLNLG